MLVAAPKLLEPAQNGRFRHILDLEAVVTQDSVAPIDDLDHPMEDIGIAAPIQCHIERAQSSLERPHDDRIPAIAQHGPHAHARRRAHPNAVARQHGIDPAGRIVGSTGRAFPQALAHAIPRPRASRSRAPYAVVPSA